MSARFIDKDDSDKIQELDAIVKQVKQLAEQVDNLTKALQIKQGQIETWKRLAKDKLTEFNARLTALESV